MMNLPQNGHLLFPTNTSVSTLAALREHLFQQAEAGSRCLLDMPLVHETAIELRSTLIAAGFLPSSAKAIQAIAFNKTATVNWKVTWHQDLMLPFAQRVTHTTFALSSIKDGIDYARPPLSVLEGLLAVRLHLDDCNESNGPLRVSPGTHKHGIIKSSDIAGYISRHGEATCIAKAGDALLMKPLLLHASSPALEPAQRRVLHLVFHSSDPMPEQWYRAV